MKLDTAVEEFLLAGRADGMRPATVKRYKSLLRSMCRTFPDSELSDVPPKLMRKYLVDLRERSSRYREAEQRPEIEGGLSEESLAGHVRALHRFWRWASVEYDVLNPMANIKRPKRKFPEPKATTMNDLAAMFSAASHDISGKRDRALLGCVDISSHPNQRADKVEESSV